MAIDTASLENMTSAEISQSLKTTHLEQAYERALHQTERIYAAERARTLHVQLLLLEDENDALQDQLVESEAQVEKLEDDLDYLRETLLQTEADLQRAQVDLKSRLRDIDYYRAEVNNLSTMSSDSTKLLTEKLSLARELAVLKPEVEHLRSQAVTQQKLLAEKLSLQRELSTLQVELETEKRAVQRTKARDNKTGEDESKLEAQIEELKKELARDKRETQKNERETRKLAADWEGQKTILESKLDAFRNKLRSTKEQLKETQTKLEQTEATKVRQTEFAEARPSAANPRKRPVARFDPDATIGTPGLATKKARISTLPGDKSTFSITPFLNRTMSVAPESPASQEKKVDEAINEQIEAIIAETAPSSPEPAPKAKAVKKTGVLAAAKAKEQQPLRDTTNPRANTTVPKHRNAATSKTTLAKVMEETVENQDQTENPSALLDIQSKQPIKKKQKLLGQRQSLFDDDDDDDRGQSKPKGFKGMSTGLGLRGGAGRGMISLAGKGKTLAEFSPLKKDRRAAAVSVGAD